MKLFKIKQKQNRVFYSFNSKDQKNRKASPTSSKTSIPPIAKMSKKKFFFKLDKND